MRPITEIIEKKNQMFILHQRNETMREIHLIGDKAIAMLLEEDEPFYDDTIKFE